MGAARFRDCSRERLALNVAYNNGWKTEREMETITLTHSPNTNTSLDCISFSLFFSRVTPSQGVGRYALVINYVLALDHTILLLSFRFPHKF